MPADFSIAIAPGRGRSKPGPVPGERRQPMRGYEGRYTDIVDYIVGITAQIWEQQDVGYVYDTYSPDVRLHDEAGLQVGVEGVVEATVGSINACPDVHVLADDVIWAGDHDAGFITSHRGLITGHHTGPWRWGPATGRPVSVWVIANCLSHENKIDEEWLLDNTAARLINLGYDVRACARAHAEAGGLVTMGEQQRNEVDRLINGRRPERYRADAHPGRHSVEHTVRAAFHDTYNRRDLSAIDRAYAHDVRWHGASGREGVGRSEVRAMARSLLATFPDLALRVEEVFWMGNDTDGHSASVRWSAAGTHRGHGLYGAPTGRRVHLWGISQVYLRGGYVVEEWALFNEFDVLTQLVAPGATPP